MVVNEREPERHAVTLRVNGDVHSISVEARHLLVHALRDDLGLTGTHIGCDTSLCGACAIDIDGDAVKSCTVLAVMADGAEITTIEGLAAGNGLHPIPGHGISPLISSTQSAIPRSGASTTTRSSKSSG